MVYSCSWAYCFAYSTRTSSSSASISTRRLKLLWITAFSSHILSIFCLLSVRRSSNPLLSCSNTFATFAIVSFFIPEAFSIINAPLSSLAKVSATSFLFRTAPAILATLPEKLLSLYCISRISPLASASTVSSSSPVMMILPV